MGYHAEILVLFLQDWSESGSSTGTPGVTHPSWNLILPSALLPTGKYQQTPQSLPTPCPCRQAEERLQIHNHSPLPCCNMLPTPKLNKQLITNTFQQRQNYSHPPDILIKNKRQPSTYNQKGLQRKGKRKILLCMRSM